MLRVEDEGAFDEDHIHGFDPTHACPFMGQHIKHRHIRGMARQQLRQCFVEQIEIVGLCSLYQLSDSYRKREIVVTWVVEVELALLIQRAFFLCQFSVEVCQAEGRHLGGVVPRQSRHEQIAYIALVYGLRPIVVA